MFRRLDEKVLVAGQIAPEQVADAAAEGVTLIVNNRPDREEPGQPDGALIAAAAERAGLGYRHIPVAGGLSPAQVDETAEALGSAEGKVLLYCRSGTRSVYLWALAEASRGSDADGLIASAAAAGYDIGALRPHLRATD